MKRIANLVVLALENRSFDHLMGNMMSPTYCIDGLTGHEFNYTDPTTNFGPICVTQSASYVPDVDPEPGHAFHDAMLQLFRQYTAPQNVLAHNDGFVYAYAKVTGDVAHAGRVMQCFGIDQLPALHKLAREFLVCDRWFSSVPGPTWPNRFFMHCATSGGFVDNALRLYDMPTIYDNLRTAGVDWRIYYHDIPQSMALKRQHQYFAGKYEEIVAFFRDCQAGKLPAYSFIEPRYFNFGSSRANDQHPIHGVPLGDNLIADVYEALRSSPQWPESMLLLIWDEHGGFYDHVLPPSTVSPDGKAAPEFDFTRLGLRVPAVLVSPYIERGGIDRTVYDHSSVAATAKEVFALPNFLTKRDAAANTFAHVLSLDTPRQDCPLKLPRIDMSLVPAPEAQRPATATGMHQSLLNLSESLLRGGTSTGVLPVTEDEAAERALSALSAFKLQGGRS